jgi:DNA-binding XRE family transcriptional regulator
MTPKQRAEFWHRRRNLDEKQADLCREFGITRDEYNAMMKDLDEKVGGKNSPCTKWGFDHTAFGYAKDASGNLIMRREYERFMGAIPESGLVHTCNNAGCIRVGHMVSGDEARRQRMVYEIRAAKPKPHNRGEKNGKSKLTWEKVNEMRMIHAKRAMTHAQLAQRYGVCKSTVADIVTYRKWKNPTEDQQ